MLGNIERSTTVRIPLRGQDGAIRAYALIDADDADDVNRWTWCLSKGRKLYYVVGSVRADGQTRGRVTRLGRYLLQAGPDDAVDHKNGDTLDHRRANLRILTPAQNAQNRRGATVRSDTGVRGVHKMASGRYQARVFHNRRQVWSATFGTLGEAAAAVSAARKIHLPYSET